MNAFVVGPVIQTQFARSVREEHDYGRIPLFGQSRCHIPCTDHVDVIIVGLDTGDELQLFRIETWVVKEVLHQKVNRITDRVRVAAARPSIDFAENGM